MVRNTNPTEATKERQEVALLLSERRPAAVFFDCSEEFWKEHWEWLPESYGMILMQTGASQDGFVSLPTTTLLFDARRREAGQYIWQISHATENLRTVRQLSVTPFEIQGTLAEFNAQGARLNSSVQLDQLETDALQQEISQLLGHAEIEEASKTFRTKKELATAALEKYIIEEPHRHNIISIIEAQFTPELERRRQQVAKIGFTALVPYSM